MFGFGTEYYIPLGVMLILMSSLLGVFMWTNGDLDTFFSGTSGIVADITGQTTTATATGGLPTAGPATTTTCLNCPSVGVPIYNPSDNQWLWFTTNDTDGGIRWNSNYSALEIEGDVVVNGTVNATYFYGNFSGNLSGSSHSSLADLDWASAGHTIGNDTVMYFDNESTQGFFFDSTDAVLYATDALWIYNSGFPNAFLNMSAGVNMSPYANQYFILAQSDTDGAIEDRFSVTGDGWVGVGTITPDDVLDVAGDIILTGAASYGSKYIYTDSAGSSGNNLTVQAGYGGCFTEGMMVRTPTGDRRIDSLQVGDKISAYDVNTSTSVVTTIQSITVLNESGYYLLNNVIQVTAEHPFWTQRGWVTAAELTTSDQLFDGTSWVSINSISYVAGQVEVYKVEVGRPYTFFVEGVLVHNKNIAARPGGDLYLAGGYGTYGGADGDVYLCADTSGSIGNCYVESELYVSGDISAYDIYADYFIGNGSLLTDINGSALTITPNSWLWFNYPTNTVGIRYNSTDAVMETNADWRVNDGLLMLDTNYGLCLNETCGSWLYYDPNNYTELGVTNSDIWIGNYGAGGVTYIGGSTAYFTTDNLIPQTNLTLDGYLFADYVSGDGSLLTNIQGSSLDISDNEWLWFNTANTTGIRYNSTDDVMETNNDLRVLGGDFNVDAYQNICFDRAKTVCSFYNATNGVIDSSNNAWDVASLVTTQIRLHDSMGNSSDIYYNGTNFEFNDNVVVYGNVTADYFFGDGSQLTNVNVSTADHALLSNLTWNTSGHYIGDNQWLYLDTANTTGIRFANATASPPTGQIEVNYKFYAPNIYSGNAVTGQTMYTNYLVMGNPAYSPGVTDHYFYMVNPDDLKLSFSMSKTGAMTFWQAQGGNSYITWKDNSTPTPYTMAGIGVYNATGVTELEIWTKDSTTDPIQMYSTTNLWEDTALQDGKYLFFDTSRTKSLWYDSGDSRFEFNDTLYAPSFVGNGSTLYDVNYTETDPLWVSNSSLVAYIANEGTWNVNSSNYWDALDDPDDIISMLNFYNKTDSDGRYLQSYTETDPLWTANSSTVARNGTCPSGYAVQNTTITGVDCVLMVASETDPLWSGNSSLVAYIANEGTWNVNSSNYWDALDDPDDIISMLNFYNKTDSDGRYLQSFTETDPLWAGNSSLVAYVANEATWNVNSSDYWDLLDTPDDIISMTSFYNKTDSDGRYLQSYTETDPLWSGNDTSVARIGDCPAGEFVVNTTTGGVQCAVPSVGAETDPLWASNSTLVAYIANEGTWNVNSSAYWDALDDPSDISHTLLADIGTYNHTEIDSHIDDATIHFTQSQIDHSLLQNLSWSVSGHTISGDTLVDFNAGGTAKTLTWNTTTTQFEFSDKVYINGALNVTGDVNTGGYINATTWVDAANFSIDDVEIIDNDRNISDAETTFTTIGTYNKTTFLGQNMTLGNTTNWFQVDVDGKVTLNDSARVWKREHYHPGGTTASPVKPYATTLGGEAYSDTGAATLGPYYALAFANAVTAGPVGNSVALQWIVPGDAVGGANTIQIRVHLFSADANTGNLKLNYGYRYASTGAAYPTVTSDGGSQTTAVSGVQYGKVVDTYLYNVAFAKGDTVVFHFGRDGEDATDTYDGSVYLTDVEIIYLSDGIGERQ